MKYLGFFIFFLHFQTLFAQDLNYAKSVVFTLASPQYYGRGYLKNGDKKAAKFVQKQFRSFKLLSFSKNYYQPLSFPINTITKIKRVEIDNRKMMAGTDFMINAASKGIHGKFQIVYLSDATIKDDISFQNIVKQDFTNKFILTSKEFADIKKLSQLHAKGYIFTRKNLLWSVYGADAVSNFMVLNVEDSLIDSTAKNISINFKNKFIPQHPSQNVIGMVEGKANKDSFIVICAHYDHIGMMGKNTYFPGANDNASGVSMMLDMAKYYSQSQNQPSNSMIFIAFCGEEAGLLGSTYCAENPPFELKKVKVLVNLDMVGTGSQGITIVNGTVFQSEFDKFKTINDSMKYVLNVNSRGESCNSDHCPFYKKGVPAFFIYSNGGEYKEYHNVKDKAEKLPFTDYEDIFKLIKDYFQTFDNE